MNLQLNATSALWEYDSLDFLLANFTQTYSKKYDLHKRVGGEGQALGYSFFGKKGLHIGLVVEREGQAPGTCVVEFCLRLNIHNSKGVSS